MFSIFNKDKKFFQILEEDNFPEFHLIFHYYYPKVLSGVSSLDPKDERVLEVFKEALVLLYEKLKSRTIERENSLEYYLTSLFKALWNDYYGFVFSVDKEIEQIVKNDYLNELKEDEGYKRSHRILLELSDYSRKLLISYYWKRQNPHVIAKKYNIKSANIALEKLRHCKQIFLEKM